MLPAIGGTHKTTTKPGNNMESRSPSLGNGTGNFDFMRDGN